MAKTSYTKARPQSRPNKLESIQTGNQNGELHCLASVGGRGPGEVSAVTNYRGLKGLQWIGSEYITRSWLVDNVAVISKPDC